MTDNNIQQLQLLQQNLQNIIVQKQQIQNQIIELDSALKELNSTEKAYKIVGKIMIASSKEELLKDLNEKKEVANVRLNNFSKQEEKLQENIDSVQKEVMDNLKQENSTNKK